MHHLYINAQFKAEDAWQLHDPASYEVSKSEPMMKGGSIDLSMLPQYTEIFIALQQAGVLEWVRSTAYDELWTYLKSYFQAIPKNQSEPTASLKVKDSAGKLRVSLDGLTPSQLSNAKIRIKKAIEVNADGSSSESETIDVSLKK